ncbi:MAG: Ig-like domain-containing protein [Candidatus Aerophobetes bacterium]|nr:Ig-like domain-containing protein [Candidatus Aerophobetes bacterium]
MKKLVYLIVLIVIFGLIISGCIFPVVPPSGKDESIDIVKDAVFCKIDLIAGQHTVAGFITVSNDDKNLFVTYETADNWLINKTHLYVGTTIPTKSAPGKFPYKHEDLEGVTTDTYEIPLEDLGVGPCNIIYIAAHAELFKGKTEETGWAEGEEIRPGKNWAMYFEYRLSCMEEIAMQILEIQDLGRQYFEQLESQGDPNALQKTIDYLKTQPNVDNAKVGEDGVSIWVVYKSGVEGIILTEPFRSLGNLPVSKSYRSNLPKKSEDKKAIILLPFDSIEGYEDKSVDELSSCLQQSGYPESSIETYRGGEVTVDLMATLSNYDFIYMATHGIVGSSGIIGVSIGQAVNGFSMVALWDSLTGDSKEIWIVSVPAKFWGFDVPGIAFALNSRFFTHYTYPDSFVYMNACDSLKNDSLADAFLYHGASVYLGWDNTSFLTLGNIHNQEFFQELAKPNNTFQQAYDNTIAMHYPASVYKDTNHNHKWRIVFKDGEDKGDPNDTTFDYDLSLIFRRNSQFILNPLVISSVEVLPETMTLTEGDSQSIDSIIAYYENGSTADIALDACTYDSSDPVVATVDAGVITAVAPGNATITVSYTEGEITKTDTVEVTVTPATPNVYNITASAGPNGSISPSGDVNVNQGSDKSFTVTHDAGYKIDDVLVDGISVGAISSYTFVNVAEDHTISVTFISIAPGPVYNLTKNNYYDTIQAALDDADNDNTIEVADGTYNESISFPFDKLIILQSVNGASSTIIQATVNQTATVFSTNYREGTTLEGFTITHADGQSGRGILIYTNLNIKNCIISGNHIRDGYGGGISNLGTLTITGSTISGNTALPIGFGGWAGGGGIYNSGTLTIIGSTISDNYATYESGGIFNEGSLTITGSTISDNYSYQGGGIFNGGSSLTITGSTISGNNAIFYGGGIHNSGTLTITGSTISGNSASLYGGILNGGGSLTITGSTISGNSARSNYGGIYLSYQTSETLSIGGSSDAEKNTICGNYKIGEPPSLDQQIRDDSGSLYEIYEDTNYISASCK